jgi:hypothetical protein
MFLGVAVATGQAKIVRIALTITVTITAIWITGFRKLAFSGVEATVCSSDTAELLLVGYP